MSHRHQKHSDKILQITPHVDFKKIKAALLRLKKHKDALITNIPVAVKEDFKFIGDNLTLLYETNHYKTFYEHIIDCFKDVDTHIPNTIGAYLHGCNVDTNLDMAVGCSVICAGSVPNVSSQYSHKNGFDSFRSNSDSHFCGSTVMLADWDGKRFVFTDQHDVQPRKSILMYTSFAKASEFPGFSATEKSYLKNYGIEKINLLYYNRAGSHYTELLNGAVKVDNLPERESSPSSVAPHSGSTSSSASSNSSNNSSVNNGNGNNGNGVGVDSALPVVGTHWLMWLLIIIFVVILIMILMRNRRSFAC